MRLDELEHVSGAVMLADSQCSSLLVGRLDAEGDVDELAGTLLEDEVGAVRAVCQIPDEEPSHLFG